MVDVFGEKKFAWWERFKSPISGISQKRVIGRALHFHVGYRTIAKFNTIL